MIISWLTIFLSKDIEERINVLDMINGQIKKITEDKINVFNLMNNGVKNFINSLYLVYKITGLNVIILTFKAVKILGDFIPTVKDLYNITVLCLGKFIPFIVLVLTLFFSFALMMNFYFGRTVEEATTITSAI